MKISFLDFAASWKMFRYLNWMFYEVFNFLHIFTDSLSCEISDVSVKLGNEQWNSQCLEIAQNCSRWLKGNLNRILKKQTHNLVLVQSIEFETEVFYWICELADGYLLNIDKRPNYFEKKGKINKHSQLILFVENIALNSEHTSVSLMASVFLTHELTTLWVVSSLHFAVEETIMLYRFLFKPLNKIRKTMKKLIRPAKRRQGKT